MKHFFTEIFEYQHHVNQLVNDLLLTNEQKLPATVMPLWSHVMNAHQIWNARILNDKPFSVDAIHTLNECIEINDINFSTTKNIIATHDFEKEIAYTNAQSESYTSIIKDILFHASNHTTHHRAQIMAQLRQANIPPFSTDYIFYNRTKIEH